MQLEQQETFEIHGPQLKALGKLEDKLPAPVRKKQTALLALVLAAVIAFAGIGGARLKGLYNDTARIYTAGDKYGNTIQTDLTNQADAAASLIRVAGGVLDANDDALQTAQAALDAWNADAAASTDPAVQYDRQAALYYATEDLYASAVDTADSTTVSKLDDLETRMADAQVKMARTGQSYNEQVDAYNKIAGGFPASVLAVLWGANDLAKFAP